MHINLPLVGQMLVTMSNGFATMRVIKAGGGASGRDEVAEAQNTYLPEHARHRRRHRENRLTPSPPPWLARRRRCRPRRRYRRRRGWKCTVPGFTAAALVSLLVPSCWVNPEARSSGAGEGNIPRATVTNRGAERACCRRGAGDRGGDLKSRSASTAVRMGSQRGDVASKVELAMEDEEGTEMEDFSSGSESRATTPSWVSCRVGAASESAPPSSRGEKSDRSDGSDNSSFGQPMSSVRNLLGMRSTRHASCRRG